MHSSDAFVGYHGRSNRGKVEIDWSLGRVDGLIPSPPPPPAKLAGPKQVTNPNPYPSP